MQAAPLPQPPGFPLGPSPPPGVSSSGLIWEGWGGGGWQGLGAAQACQVAGEAAAGKAADRSAENRWGCRPEPPAQAHGPPRASRREVRQPAHKNHPHSSQLRTLWGSEVPGKSWIVFSTAAAAFFGGPALHLAGLGVQKRAPGRASFYKEP